MRRRHGAIAHVPSGHDAEPRAPRGRADERGGRDRSGVRAARRRSTRTRVWDGLLRPALRGRARRPADLRRRRRAHAGTPWPTRWTRTSAAGAPAPGWSRYVQEALPLGKQAVAGALDDAGLAPGDVGLFAVATCTGYATPGLDIRLASDLGMPAGLQRLLVGHMGCYAALPGPRRGRATS